MPQAFVTISVRQDFEALNPSIDVFDKNPAFRKFMVEGFLLGSQRVPFAGLDRRYAI